MKKQFIFNSLCKKIINKMQIVNDSTELKFLSNKTQILSFVNAHAINISINDNSMANALLKSDILLRDGIGVKILLKLIGEKPGINMNGTDAIPKIIHSNIDKKVALLGAEKKYNDDARHLFTREGVNVVLNMDGFQSDISYINKCLEAQPDIILLGMGMPKQEILSILLKEQLVNNCLIINGGALIDFKAGKFHRAPLFVRKVGFEWLYRLCKEPSRLWKRYIIGNFIFLCRSVIYSVGLKIKYRKN